MTYNKELSYQPHIWDTVKVDGNGNLQGMLTDGLAKNIFHFGSNHCENKKKSTEDLPITKIKLKHNHRGQVIR